MPVMTTSRTHLSRWSAIAALALASASARARRPAASRQRVAAPVLGDAQRAPLHARRPTDRARTPTPGPSSRSAGSTPFAASSAIPRIANARRVAPVPLRHRHLRPERHAGLRDAQRAPASIHPLHATTIVIVGPGGVEFSYWHVVPSVRSGQHVDRLPDGHRAHRGAVRPRPLLGGARRPLPEPAATRRAGPVRRTARARRIALASGVVARARSSPRPTTRRRSPSRARGTTSRSCRRSCAGGCSTRAATSFVGWADGRWTSDSRSPPPPRSTRSGRRGRCRTTCVPPAATASSCRATLAARALPRRGRSPRHARERGSRPLSARRRAIADAPSATTGG